MEDSIKTYCHFCLEPLYESDFLAGFAVTRTIRKLDHQPFQVSIHLYHSREAQDVLKDKEYMEAVGVFLKRLEFMSKSENVTNEDGEAICVDAAKQMDLDKDRLELAIKAFYSYSLAEIRRKGAPDGDTPKTASESGDQGRSDGRVLDDGPAPGLDGKDERSTPEAESGTEVSDNIP